MQSVVGVAMVPEAILEKLEPMSQSVCHFLILEKAPFSVLKLTSVHSVL